jgi:rare lipoprotein A
MTRRQVLTVAAAGVFVQACGHKRTAVRTPPAPSPIPSAPSFPTPGDSEPETGLASWYGHPYHGRASASGEIYDMEQMTAAHRTLAFGTRVRVENLDNGMSTEVRINDRGPFIEGRIIDLSHAAAVAIGMIGPGVAHVKLTINGLPSAPEPPIFAVQTGAFANRDNADRLQVKMAERYGAATLRLRAGTPPLWRLLVGKAPSTGAAETLARQIRNEQSIPEAFVVRLDPSRPND